MSHATSAGARQAEPHRQHTWVPTSDADVDFTCPGRRAAEDVADVAVALARHRRDHLAIVRDRCPRLGCDAGRRAGGAVTYTVRPISDRTTFTGRHEQSLFSASWSDTSRLLLREVGALRGRNLVLECDVREEDIRLDGEIKANARPATPAVRVAFESKHGPLTYATDKFWHWQDNVRAIALGLESLRRVARYGITERGEQYTGFKALPAGRAMPASHMTATEAAQLLERVAIGSDLGPTRDRVVEQIRTDKAHAREVWREARKVCHPDRRNGDQSMWDQVEQAAAVLGVAS